MVVFIAAESVGSSSRGIINTLNNEMVKWKFVDTRMVGKEICKLKLIFRRETPKQPLMGMKRRERRKKEEHDKSTCSCAF